MARDNMLKAGIFYVAGLVPLSRSAGAANGSAIDLLASNSPAGPYNAGLVILETGAATGGPTAQSVTVKIQESADGSTGWTDVTDLAEVEAATVVSDADNQVKTLAFYPTALKQYIRVVATTAFTGGTTPAQPSSVLVVLGEPTRI